MRELLGQPMGARFTVSGERDKRKDTKGRGLGWPPSKGRKFASFPLQVDCLIVAQG
jgi:hypothetical protein